MSATHPAYFMGRAEILGWINETIGTRLTKIEDTATGAIACAIMDALHPGVVPIKKVDFNARSEYDMINNYKVLQEVFNKLGVDKYIEVNKLIKAKPLDNMEFMQWFKMYHDQVTNGQPVTGYDGAGRRAQSKTGDIKSTGGPAPAVAKQLRAGSENRAPNVAAYKPPAVKTGGSPVTKAPSSAEVAELRAKLEEKEKEKDFYWSKLRDIELMCQTPKICEVEVMKRVEAILYAATAEEGRQILIDTQKEMAGGVFLDEAEMPADA
mmetsp:Transcript_9602/g.23810  ORF Transcript_9602/g.23810 Transcript_9602/m.23810 type:complete len:266 (-) Transcript_9602:420-1217(-)|eukprot:CAMPEP_0202868864 /NCGR_PEP_ID=MMETSP1391-20130828/11250_1 /ASSEMBLY_ACC=CAM_ASM_000867 /TAXON_ID=1034604 /ORGANISM="Chlamydomonas leiostraca, Strain SAG 11-49" /LENGTH=265 /DNA_ID=CAMNT_0049549081 /DNA_START=77 /DNA_END=874 /DNA_ORIENTATION=+